jgi:hypothetical protein
MANRSTRTRNITKLKQALGHLDSAASIYDEAIEVYLPMFPEKQPAVKNVFELLVLARDLMESSFEGI